MSDSFDILASNTVDDLPSIIATAVMGLPWASGGDVDTHCNRYGDLQELMAATLAQARDRGDRREVAQSHPNVARILDQHPDALDSDVIRQSDGLLFGDLRTLAAEPPAPGAGGERGIPHPLTAALAWLHREYREGNPLSGEAVTWKARSLVAALALFMAAETIAPPVPPAQSPKG